MSQRRRRAIVSSDVLDQIVAGQALPAAAARYLTRVLRLEAGTTVEIGDGTGRIASGRLESADDAWLLAGVDRVERVADVAPITLYAGLLKPKRWRLLVEKCVELGVERLVPVLAARSQMPARREASQAVARWNRIAVEAAKQCRRALATGVVAPAELAASIESEGAPNRLVADAGGLTSWPERGLVALAPTALLVGPEGGFTESEREQAERAGFQPIRLGGFTLRAETAAVALIAMARDRLGFASDEASEDACL